MTEKILLKIEKLKAGIKEKEILKGINLQIKKGEVQVLLGPNASGKSTLAQLILGSPKYKIKQGKIFFEGKDITGFPPEKRVKIGIVLSWQSPPAIKGITLSQLIEKISKILKSKPFLTEDDFNLDLISRELMERDLNLGFSGGEKKISELIQVLNLKPKLVIFDEIDSGLDIKKLKKVAEIIKRELIQKNVSILIITHGGQILEYIKPNLVQVLVDGKIICQGKNYKKILKTIKKYGYEKCKKCYI